MKNHYSLSILFAFFCLPFCMMAQEIYSKHYIDFIDNTTIEADYLHLMDHAIDNQGFTYGVGGGESDGIFNAVFICKVDANGTALDIRILDFDFLNNTKKGGLHQVLFDSDSSLMVVGVLNDTTSSLLKFDRDLNLIWERHVQGRNEGSSLHLAPDSNYVWLLNEANALVKLDTDNNLLWTNQYQEANTPQMHIEDLMFNTDSTMLIVGGKETNTIGSAILIFADEVGIVDSALNFNAPSFKHIQLAMDTLYLFDEAFNLHQVSTEGLHQGIFNVGGSFGMGWGSTYFENEEMVLINDSILVLSEYTPHIFGSMTFINLIDKNEGSAAGDNLNTSFAFNGNGMVSIGANGPVYGLKAPGHQIDHFGLVAFTELEDLFTPIYSCSGVVTQWRTMSTQDPLDSLAFDAYEDFYNVQTGSVNVSITQEVMVDHDGCVSHLGSLTENELDKLWTISPNPSNGLLSVEWTQPEPVNISLITLDGKTLQTNELVQGQNALQLMVGRGVYLLKLTLEDGTHSIKKIAIQ